jgi:hypothetical protein
MAVRGPTIGFVHAECLVTVARAGGGPKAEGAIDVDPSVVGAGEGDELGEGVKGTYVEVGGLEQEDGGGITGGEGAGEGGGSQLSRGI